MTLRHAVIVITLLGMAACTTIEDCQNDTNRSDLIVGFVHAGIVAFDSIRVDDRYRPDGDTDTLSTISSPLDPEVDQARIVFYTDSADYWLGVRYQSQIQIFEIDCDPSLYVYDLDTAGTSFDSLAIQRTILTNTSLNADIEIYF